MPVSSVTCFFSFDFYPSGLLCKSYFNVFQLIYLHLNILFVYVSIYLFIYFAIILRKSETVVYFISVRLRIAPKIRPTLKKLIAVINEHDKLYSIFNSGEIHVRAMYQ